MKSASIAIHLHAIKPALQNGPQKLLIIRDNKFNIGVEINGIAG